VSNAYRSSRRRFLSSLGLGVGATILGPIAAGLHQRAWGAEMGRPKNVVFISMSSGLPDLQLGWPSRTDERTWALHEALAPLAPWRERMTIVRNLSLGMGAMQHSGGHGLMAGRGTGDGETPLGTEPVAQTIDQLLAARIGGETPIPSLLFGVDQDAQKVVHQSIFARAAGQLVPYPVRASKLYEALFPAAPGNATHRFADRRVMARIHADVGRLSSRLASPERERLGSYLESLEGFDRRRSATQCLATDAPLEARGAVNELPAMLDMAAVALRCGLTRVVGCAVGAGNSHFHFPALIGPHIGTRFEEQGYVGEHGHDGEEMYDAGRTVAFRWLSQQVATFLRQLEPPAGPSILADTVVVLFSDGAHAHHNLEAGNWRFVLIGDAGGALKPGGRFLTFRGDVSWEPLRPDTRSVNSLWCTLATAAGAPIDAFGVGGARTNGPLSELLA